MHTSCSDNVGRPHGHGLLLVLYRRQLPALCKLHVALATYFEGATSISGSWC